MSGHTVTVGVPVYRGQDFVAEALATVQAQSYRDLRVLISLDGPDPVCEEAVRPFLADRRFVLTTRQNRRGWVGNLNWLMRHTDTAYWCYHQQDDLIDPDYLAELVDHLRATPKAAVAYCDIQAFGQADWRIEQDSVTGHPVTRQLALLHEHLAAVAFRGVTRTEAIRHMGRLPANPEENFAVDTVWMAAMARSGELHRVPGYRYRKRYHDANVHTKWPTWPAPRRHRAWATHCADLLHEALQVPQTTVQERRLLWGAAVGRLTHPRLAAGYASAEELGAAERTALLATYTARIRTHRPAIATELDFSVHELRCWTAELYRPEGGARPDRLCREVVALARQARHRLGLVRN